MPDEPLRYVMIGGGPGSFMGPVHRRALAFVGRTRLVGGAFSRDPRKNASAAAALDLPGTAVFANPERLASALKNLRADFGVVVSPTSAHYEAVRLLLQAGLPVVCDKPLCADAARAEDLARLSRELDLPVMVTYTYSGFPMLAEARQRVLNGELGELRLVVAQYEQDWMTRRFAASEAKSRFWRADPARSSSCCVADIGVHLEHMIRFVTGRGLSAVSARLQSFTEGTSLDDNAFIHCRMEGGLEASLWCSQVCVGKHNQLTLKVVGGKGSLEWRHPDVDVLRLFRVGEPEAILRRGDPNLCEAARNRSFLPLEHPEGYGEAFAALYASFCRFLEERRAGCGRLEKPGAEPGKPDFPTAADGAAGLRFVEACLQSHAQEGAWISSLPC